MHTNALINVLPFPAKSIILGPTWTRVTGIETQTVLAISATDSQAGYADSVPSVKQIYIIYIGVHLPAGSAIFVQIPTSRFVVQGQQIPDTKGWALMIGMCILLIQLACCLWYKHVSPCSPASQLTVCRARKRAACDSFFCAASSGATRSPYRCCTSSRA